MDPISIITGGIILGIVFFGILLLIPKAREYQEKIAREEAAIQTLVNAQGWRITRPEKGDVKWVIQTHNWQLIYDADSSSDSSTPHLQWIAPTPAEAKARFVVLTEAGLKMMRHPFTRKAFTKLQGFAEKHARTKLKTTLAQPQIANPQEIFEILDSKNEATIVEVNKKKLVLAASSHTSLQAVKNSDIPRLLSAVIANEKLHISDNTERLAQFSNRIEIKTYVTRPTADLIKSIVQLGEQTLALKL